MMRRFGNLLTSLSLLLCVAAAALWVRSHFVADQITWRRVDGARWVVSSPGYVVVGVELADWSGWPAEGFGLRYESGTPAPPIDHVVRMLVLNVGPRDTFLQRQWAGFGWWHWRPRSGPVNFLRLVVPLWAVVMVTAAFPLLRAACWWRRARRRSGFCRSCGYDLRATPERCPECGKPALDS